MKTYIPVKVFLSFCFIIITVISCSKKDDTVSPVTVTQVTHPSPTAIGAIVDSGIISPGTRVMKMELNPQYFTLYDAQEQVSSAAAKVNVAFYVNDDGSIPAGEYRFSDSDGKTPFTFDSATLSFIPGSNSQASNTDQVVDGTIKVSQQGSVYVFSLQINLASGMTTSQIYTGVFDYADSMN
jgi:hypothetical protein